MFEFESKKWTKDIHTDERWLLNEYKYESRREAKWRRKISTHTHNLMLNASSLAISA